MDTSNIKEEVSDDEVHFEKLTINKIKKLLCNRQGQGPSKPYDDVSTKEDDPDSSLRLIKTHSQPNLRLNIADSPSFISQSGSPAIGNDSDQSFIHMENVVTKLFASPQNAENVELNGTLEIIDYILSHGPNHGNVQEPGVKMHDKQHVDMFSVTKQKRNEFVTPSNCINSKTPTLKSPACPSSIKKPSTPRLTPGKYATNAYKHISSPIASYIKNCPQAPLVRDVHPNKPLPTSSIQKLVRNSTQSKVQINKNKESASLPSIAYQSAKKTKVVQLPDENRFPQSQWINKMTSSVPRATVMKHEKRIMNPVKNELLLNQENSFANLPCQQAEESLCTEKTAFRSTNK